MKNFGPNWYWLPDSFESGYGFAVFDLAVFDLAVFDLAVFDLAVFDLAVFDLAVFDLAVFDFAASDFAASDLQIVIGRGRSLAMLVMNLAHVHASRRSRS